MRNPRRRPAAFCPRAIALAALLGSLAGGLAVPAAADGVLVGGAAGTPGLGFFAGLPIGERVELRGVLHGGSYDRDFTASRVDYRGELKLSSLAALLDFHPTGGGFRMSAGLFFNQSEIEGVAPLAQLLDRVPPGVLPPKLVLPDDLGRLTATYELQRVSPYLGLGYGRPVGRSGWSFHLDFGAHTLDDPEVELVLETDLPIDQIPGGRELVDDLLARHRADLEEELDEAPVYPVLSLGLGYRF